MPELCNASGAALAKVLAVKGVAAVLTPSYGKIQDVCNSGQSMHAWRMWPFDSIGNQLRADVQYEMQQILTARAICSSAAPFSSEPSLTACLSMCESDSDVMNSCANLQHASGATT